LITSIGRSRGVTFCGALDGFQGLVEKKELNKYNPYAQAYLRI